MFAELSIVIDRVNNYSRGVRFSDSAPIASTSVSLTIISSIIISIISHHIYVTYRVMHRCVAQHKLTGQSTNRIPICVGSVVKVLSVGQS